MTFQIASYTPVQGQPGLFRGSRGLAGLDGYDVSKAAPWLWAAGWADALKKKVSDTKAMQDWWARLGADERKRLRVVYLAVTRHAPPGLTPKQGSKWWGDIGKDKRAKLKDKYDGETFLEQAAGTVSSVAKFVPVVGTAVSVGIDTAMGQGVLKDPTKLLTYAVAGQNAGQLAPFISKKGLRLNEQALKESLKASTAILGAGASGAPAGSMNVPKLPQLPKMPDITKLAKQGAPVLKDVLKQAQNTAVLSNAMKKASGVLSKTKLPVPVRIPSAFKKQAKVAAAKNNDVLALQKQLNALLAKDRKEDASQAAQLVALQNELNKTKQEAETQNAIQRAVQEALARQSAMQPQYAQQPMYQPFPGYAPQYAPQAQPMYAPQQYASQMMPQLSPEDYAAMQLPTSLSGLHGVLF